MELLDIVQAQEFGDNLTMLLAVRRPDFQHQITKVFGIADSTASNIMTVDVELDHSLVAQLDLILVENILLDLRVLGRQAAHDRRNYWNMIQLRRYVEQARQRRAV